MTTLPLLPPVLPMLQGVAGALRADLAARPTSAALNGGVLPEDEGVVLKRPARQPPGPSPNPGAGKGRVLGGGRAWVPRPLPPPQIDGRGRSRPPPAGSTVP